MGSIATSNKASQATTNKQVGVNGTAASGSSGNVAKGGSQAVGQGISLVFNTGNNKVSANNSKATAKAGKNAGPAATAVPSASGSDKNTTAGSGNIVASIQQTDEGAISAGTSVSLASIGAIQDANNNIVSLADHALQAGASIAALAIPTYAAQEVAGNAINPSQPAIVESGGGSDTGVTSNTSKILIGLSVVGFALTVGMFLKRRGTA